MASKPTEGNVEITKQLERAKAALAVSRAKMEAQEQADAGLVADEKEEKNDEKDVPFFAVNTADDNDKKEKVIKDKNEEGLFTTDGDLMAKLSEEEEWESRPLLEVFQNEKEKTPETMNIDRDIGQSMYNLRKSLQTEDFRTIFDKRNRFIGEA
jgi:2,4-dienoyl-CoA reductase-like NADH-dependent reductase (Old Yellow Enzyme family)